MNKTTEALKLAEEALAGGLWDYGPGQDEHTKCEEVLAAIREVLAEPVKQEPVADYAYATIKEYEELAGFSVPEAFRAGWNMARTTNSMLGIKAAPVDAKAIRAEALAEHKCDGCAKTAADGWALYCVECWEKAEPVKQEPVEILKSSKANFERQFGKQVFADWIYDDLTYSFENAALVQQSEQEPVGYVPQSVIDWLSKNERTDGAYSSINLYKNPCDSSDAPLYAAPVDAKAIRAEALKESARFAYYVRKEALEEAAKWFEGYDNQAWFELTQEEAVAAIRGLK